MITVFFDMIPKVCQSHINERILSSNCLYQNFIALNHRKCHCICISKSTGQDSFTFEDLCLTSSKDEDILSITINNKLNFNNLIEKICRKASQKVSALCD